MPCKTLRVYEGLELEVYFQSSEMTFQIISEFMSGSLHFKFCTRAWKCILRDEFVGEEMGSGMISWMTSDMNSGKNSDINHV